MTPADMADVLTAAGAYDGRTVGISDVQAWHAAAGDLDRDDALAAVVRHYAHSTDWMKPAHLRQNVLAIRNERAERRAHEVRALPSRFEADPERAARVQRGIAEIAQRWSVPEQDTTENPIHERALARARAERGRRPIPTKTSIPKRDTKPVDLGKLQGPGWASPQAREAQAVFELHRAGRNCGLPACPRCAHAETVTAQQEQP